MKPGFHLNVPADAYHADPCEQPSLSCGVAKILLAESPRKAWHSHPRLNPKHREEHDSKFDLGTCAHAVLLENDASRIVIVEADDWRTKAAKDQRDAARAIGKTPLLSRHYDDVRRMVDAALAFIAESEIADFWHDGDSEVTGIAKDGDTTLRCRFDRLTSDRRMIVDYKSTTDVSPDAFQRQIARMGYDVQHAFYRRVARILGVKDPRFVFLAQSVESPHECTLHDLDPASVEIADAKVERAINLWCQCLNAKRWPSYDNRIHYAMPSAWQMAEHELALAEAA